MISSSKSSNVVGPCQGKQILALLVAFICALGHSAEVTRSSRHSQRIRIQDQHPRNIPTDRQLSQISTPFRDTDTTVSVSDIYEFDINGPRTTTDTPTDKPSVQPSETSTDPPTSQPSNAPTQSPSTPHPTVSAHPTVSVSPSVSASPTDSSSPTISAPPTGSAPPTNPPSNNPTNTYWHTPPNSAPIGNPTSPPTPSPTDPPTNKPTTPAPTESPTNKPTESPTGNPTGSPTLTDSRIMEEMIVEAQEQQGSTLESNFLPEDEDASQREPSVPEEGYTDNTADETILMAGESQPPAEGNVDPTDADQFLPVPDPTYYFVELQPFSVFVHADRDLTSDLGIPLYLFLEMGSTLETLVDIKITNLTINMGVVKTSTHTHRRLGESNQVEHYHWNQLFFQGFAQFDDSVVFSPVTVTNTQSVVLMSSDDGLQQFWDEQGNSDVYGSLELQNITLLPFPTPEETQAPTAQEQLPAQQQQPQTEPPVPEDSKRDSNVWIMVPLVIVFLAFCFCIICLCGRLQYLSSRAQDKYNEKYGLDYNVYDKDIGKEIFKEEYLMSEHQDDQDFPQMQLSDSNMRSIDFITKPIVSSIKAVKRTSLEQAKKAPPPTQEEQSTEEDDEEEILGGFTDGVVRQVFAAEEDRNAYYSHNGPMASARSENRRSDISEAVERPASNERAMEQNVVVDDGIIIPKLGTAVESSERGNEEEIVVESVPPDEDDDIALEPKAPPEIVTDQGDSMPSLMKPPPTMQEDTSDKDSNSRFGRSARRRDSAKRRDSSNSAKEMAGMGNSSARERSYRNTRSSFSKAGDGVMGNSSRGSRGDRSSRFNRSSGSFNQAIEKDSSMGGSGRGDGSRRSSRSIRTDSSNASFYSCQGDLV